MRMRMPSGQKRKLRDHFNIKYHYPKGMTTTKQAEFKTKSCKRDLDCFNLEKEHKVINPHNMELKTTTNICFQPFKIKQNSNKQREQVEQIPAKF